MVNLMEQDFLDADKDEMEYVLQMMKWMSSDEGSIPNASQIKHKMESKPDTEIFSPFANQEFTWKFVEPGTPVMSEVGFPASIYTIPPPMFRHLVQSINKDSMFFNVCLFRSSSSYRKQFLVLISFSLGLVHEGRPQAELMFFEHSGIPVDAVTIPELKLEYLAEIRQMKFKLNRHRFDSALKLVLCTDISASLIYNHFKEVTVATARAEKRAVEVFHRARVLFDFFKQEITYDFDESSKHEYALNVVNLTLAHGDLLQLQEAIISQQKHFADHFRRNSILLHRIHKSIWDLSQIQSQIRTCVKELEGFPFPNAAYRKKYETFSEMKVREGQIKLDLELLHLEAKENKSLMVIMCHHLKSIADGVDMRRFKHSNYQQTFVKLADSGV